MILFKMMKIINIFLYDKDFLLDRDFIFELKIKEMYFYFVNASFNFVNVRNNFIYSFLISRY